MTSIPKTPQLKAIPNLGLTALKEQVESAAATMAALEQEAPAAFAGASSLNMLRSLARHHLGYPYSVIDALLQNHDRLRRHGLRVLPGRIDPLNGLDR